MICNWKKLNYRSSSECFLKIQNLLLGRALWKLNIWKHYHLDWFSWIHYSTYPLWKAVLVQWLSSPRYSWYCNLLMTRYENKSLSYWTALFLNIELLKAYELVNLSSSLKHCLPCKWVWEVKRLTLLAQSCRNTLLLLTWAAQLLKSHGCCNGVHHKRAKTWLNLCFLKTWLSMRNKIFR